MVNVVWYLCNFSNRWEFVIYNPRVTSNYSLYTKAIWDSNTNNDGGTRLVLAEDGNLIMFNSAGGVVWTIYN